MDKQIAVFDRKEQVTILPGISRDRFRVIWHPRGRQAELFQVTTSQGETVLEAVTKELRKRSIAA